MINPIYNLPELSFVGGEKQTFLFNLLTKGGQGFQTDGCNIAFSVVGYANKSGAPILTKPVTMLLGDSGEKNIASVELDPIDTVDWYGRYIYQLSIKDIGGDTEIPGQGIMNVTRNIHRHFITSEGGIE